MNPKDILSSSDPDLAGSFAAIQRAARSAQDLAIKTNTSIVVSLDGRDVVLTAADLIKMREQEQHPPGAKLHSLLYPCALRLRLASSLLSHAL